MITNRDPETWHDQRPSHPVRPAWLIEAQEGAAAAWRAYSEEIDRQNDALEWNREKLVAMRKAASIAEQWYLQCSKFWNDGKVPPAVLAAMEAEREDNIPFDRQSDRIPTEQRWTG